MTFQKSVQRGVDTFCIITQMAEVATNKRKLSLFGINAFDAADFFNRFWLMYIAAQSVNSIGGIDNDAA